ncbi:hypothetical protein L3X38_041186 [Prunus dulcis]|uniref:Uncharacterized protein n=1 Tax=Prunus dulcis TaxID=3755 RepID=A0AAD4UTI9_PRUDU|nr:hypothetical protein L3X38_041186 [Prunus dulcis]
MGFNCKSAAENLERLPLIPSRLLDQWHLQIHQHSGLTGLKTIQLLQKPLLGVLSRATCWLLVEAGKNERELLSSHGFTQNQLTLWKYPSMAKVAELTGHTSRVLYMAQMVARAVASAAGDEIVRFWNVFEIPEVAKPAPKANPDLLPI